MEKLILILNALGQDARIDATPASRHRLRLEVR